MSATEKAFGAFKTILTIKDQLDGLDGDIEQLNARLAGLAGAHGDLRDRVARLEGIIEGAAMAAGQRRIEP